MQSSADEGYITAINVTPLVDILLVVLIIFMATAPLIHRRAIKVDVPKAAHNERAATEALQLVYNARREIFLSGQKVSPEELARVLAGFAHSDPDVHVSLSADKSISYGDVVGLLDIARGAGVKRIGLEVARK
jgi:biopolymer transport protein ExbD